MTKITNEMLADINSYVLAKSKIDKSVQRLHTKGDKLHGALVNKYGRAGTVFLVQAVVAMERAGNE